MDHNAKILKEEHFLRKEFNYSVDGVQLNFTLRVDVKKELKAFQELLEKALGDVKEEIEKL